MVKSRRGYKTSIPNITSAKAQTRQLSFKDGVDTYKDNDDVKNTQLIAAVDARMVKIGRYQTRRGLDRYSVPIGETASITEDSATGAAGREVSLVQRVAQMFTAASDSRLTRIGVRMKNPAVSGGVVVVEIREDDSGEPGTLLARSTFVPSEIPATSTAVMVYTNFNAAPLLENATDYWFVLTVQESATGAFEAESTSNSSGAAISLNNGTWTPQAWSVRHTIYTSTDTAVKGVTRAYRPNGQKTTFMAAGDTLYSVNDSTGATTAVKTGLNSSATYYRFQMVQDAIYWVNGLEKPYKNDFTTVTQITAAPYIPSLIMEHKGLLFFNDVDDKTRVFYSNFAEYGTYTSTDFIYVPAPKSYDALTAFAKLNGVLYLFANRNKFQLYGSDNTTFVLDEATDQRGTFSQESVVFDANYIYHADEEGVHRFNGTDSRNLAEPFLEDYLAIFDKTSIQLEVYNNRLYVFYAPSGSAVNSECFVINLLLNLYEGVDKEMYTARTFSRYAQDDIFIQASNKVAALYYAERSTNDYHNNGDQLQYEIKTSSSHFDTPAQLKRVPKWRPSFESVDGQYSAQAGYALDGATEGTFDDVALGSESPRYDTGLLYDTGVLYGGGSVNIDPLDLVIDGFFKRVQRRYKHIAAREPVTFDSETLSLEVQRML